MSGAMQQHLKGCTDYWMLRFSQDFLVTHSELSNVAWQNSGAEQKTVLKVPLPDFADLSDKVCPKCRSYMCVTATGESANCPCQDLFKQTTVVLQRINETKDHMKFNRKRDYSIVNNEDPMFKKSKVDFVSTGTNIRAKDALVNNYFRDDNLFEKFGVSSSFNEPMLINNELESTNTDVNDCKQDKRSFLPLKTSEERILFKYNESDDDDDKTQEYPLREGSVFFTPNTNIKEDTDHLRANVDELNRTLSSDCPSLSYFQQLHSLKMSPDIMENRHKAINSKRFPNICRTNTNQIKMKPKSFKLKSRLHKSKKAWLYRKSITTCARHKFSVSRSYFNRMNNADRHMKTTGDNKRTQMRKGLDKVSYTLPKNCLSDGLHCDERFDSTKHKQLRMSNQSLDSEKKTLHPVVRRKKLFKQNKSSFCNVAIDSLQCKEFVSNSCGEINNNKSCTDKMFSGLNISSSSKDSSVQDQNVENLRTYDKYIDSADKMISPHFVRKQPKKGIAKVHSNKQVLSQHLHNNICSKEVSTNNTSGIQMVSRTQTVNEDTNSNRSPAQGVISSSISKSIMKQHPNCFTFSGADSGNNGHESKTISDFSRIQPEAKSDQKSKSLLTVISPSKDIFQKVSCLSVNVLHDADCNPSAPVNDKLSNTVKKNTNTEAQLYFCPNKINVRNSVAAVEPPSVIHTSELVVNSTVNTTNSSWQKIPPAVVSSENVNILKNMNDKQMAKQNRMLLQVVKADKTVSDLSDVLIPSEQTCTSSSVAVELELDRCKSQLVAEPATESSWGGKKEKLHAAVGDSLLDPHYDNRIKIGHNKAQTVVSSRAVNTAHEPLDLSCHDKEQNTLHPDLACSSVRQKCLPQAYTPSLVVIPEDIGYTDFMELPVLPGPKSSFQNLFMCTDIDGSNRLLSTSSTELSKADSRPPRISHISTNKQPDLSSKVPCSEIALLNTIFAETGNTPASSIHSSSSVTQIAAICEKMKIHSCHAVTNFEQDSINKKNKHIFIAASLPIQHCSMVASSVSTASIYSPQLVTVTSPSGSCDAFSNFVGSQTDISKDMLPAQNATNASAYTSSSVFNISVNKNNVIDPSSPSGLKNPSDNFKLREQTASSTLSALPVKDFFTQPPKENTYSSLLLAKITSQKKKHLDTFSCVQQLNKSNNPQRNLYIDLTEENDDCDIVSISSNDSFDDDARNDFLDMTLRDRVPTPASLTACSSISEVTVAEGNKHLPSVGFSGEINNACSSVRMYECDFDSLLHGARSEYIEHSGLVSRNITDIGILSPPTDGNNKVHNMQKYKSYQVFEFDDNSNAEEMTVCDVNINEPIEFSDESSVLENTETSLHSLNVIPVHTRNLEHTEAMEPVHEEISSFEDATPRKLMTSVDSGYTEKLQTETQQNIVTLTQAAGISSSRHDNNTQRAAATLLELSANPLYNPYIISPETSDAYQEKVYQVHPQLKVNRQSVQDELQQDNINQCSPIFHPQAGMATHKFRARTGRRVGRPPKDAYNASDSVNSAEDNSASLSSEDNIVILAPSGLINSAQMSIKDAVSLQHSSTPGHPSNLHNSLSLKSNTKNATSVLFLSQPVIMSQDIYNEFHPNSSNPVHLKNKETTAVFTTSSLPYFVTPSAHCENAGAMKTQTIESLSGSSVSRENSVKKWENVNKGNNNSLCYTNSANYVNVSNQVKSIPPPYVTLKPHATVSTSAVGIHNARCKSSRIISKTLASVKNASLNSVHSPPALTNMSFNNLPSAFKTMETFDSDSTNYCCLNDKQFVSLNTVNDVSQGHISAHTPVVPVSKHLDKITDGSEEKKSIKMDKMKKNVIDSTFSEPSFHTQHFFSNMQTQTSQKSLFIQNPVSEGIVQIQNLKNTEPYSNHLKAGNNKVQRNNNFKQQPLHSEINDILHEFKSRDTAPDITVTTSYENGLQILSLQSVRETDFPRSDSQNGDQIVPVNLADVHKNLFTQIPDVSQSMNYMTDTGVLCTQASSAAVTIPLSEHSDHSEHSNLSTEHNLENPETLKEIEKENAVASLLAAMMQNKLKGYVQ